MLHSDNLRLSSDGNFAAAGRTSAREENDIHHGGTETQRKATPRIVPATAVLQPPPDFGLFTTEARRHREKQLHELPSDGSFAAAADFGLLPAMPQRIFSVLSVPSVASKSPGRARDINVS